MLENYIDPSQIKKISIKSIEGEDKFEVVVELEHEKYDCVKFPNIDSKDLKVKLKIESNCTSEYRHKLPYTIGVERFVSGEIRFSATSYNEDKIMCEMHLNEKYMISEEVKNLEQQLDSFAKEIGDKIQELKSKIK